MRLLSFITRGAKEVPQAVDGFTGRAVYSSASSGREVSSRTARVGSFFPFSRLRQIIVRQAFIDLFNKAGQ
jgi:hypothetical protein